MINNQKDLKKERLSEALRENLKKRKEFLKKAAQLHAEYLLTEKNLSHFQKNKELKTPEDRVKKSNCKQI